MKFRGVVELHRRRLTGISVPEEVVISLGGGKRPKGTDYHQRLHLPDQRALDGRQLLLLPSQRPRVREGAAIAAGD